MGSCYPLGDARGAVCEERPSTDEFGGLREPWRKAIIDLATVQAHEFANDFTFPGNPAGLRLNGMTYNKGERGGYYDPATDSRHLVDNDHSGQTPHLVGSSFTWVHNDPIRDPDQRFSGRTLYVMPLP